MSDVPSWTSTTPVPGFRRVRGRDGGREWNEVGQVLELLQSVLALKARPPELPVGLVGRPLLAERLTAATARPVTLVSAGPGTSKTFTVAAWAKSDDAPWPIAWLSLDASDNSVQSFWSSMLFTLGACGGVPDDNGLRDITPAAGFGPEEVLAVRARLAELPRPIVLVLDDFHEVTDDTVLTSFGELVDHLPDSLRLVLISRSDPTLRLHRLRASGDLTELRTTDLTFTAKETAALFENAGVPLRADQVEVLQDRTEGWPVGLRLAVLSLNRDDVDASIHRLSGTDKAVADYLVGEVLQQLSPHNREFLLRTSVVERISGPLADQLTGRSDSSVLLENFARANAFVIGIGGDSGWFTYHRMLRELLLYRFALEQPAALRQAHRAAAQWFSTIGDHIEAIQHSILAGDDEVAGRTLLRVIPKVLSPEGPALAGAIAPLAAAAIERPCLPTLLASAVCHYHHYEIAAMQRDVTAARQFLDEAGDARAGTEAALFLFDMAGRRCAADSAAVQTIAAQVIDLVAHTTRRVLPAGPAFRVIAVINRAGAQIWTGGTADTATVLNDAAEEAFELGLLLPQLNALGHLALLDVFAGRCTAAARRAAEATEIIDRRGWGSEPQALATYLAQALIDLARHRPTAAGQHVRRGLAASGQHTDRTLRIALGIAWVEATIGRGDARAAIAADARVIDGIDRTPAAPALLRSWAAAAGAEALLSAGEPEKARARIAVQTPMASTNGHATNGHATNGHATNGHATNPPRQRPRHRRPGIGGADSAGADLPGPRSARTGQHRSHPNADRSVALPNRP